MSLNLPPLPGVIKRRLAGVEFALLTGRNALRLAYSDPRFEPSNEVESRHRERAVAILTDALAELDKIRRDYP